VSRTWTLKGFLLSFHGFSHNHTTSTTSIYTMTRFYSVQQKARRAELRKIRRANRSQTQIAIDAAKKKAERKPLTDAQRAKNIAGTVRWSKANPARVAAHQKKYNMTNRKPRKPLTLAQKRRKAETDRLWVLANPGKIAEYREKAKKKREAERALLRLHEEYEVTYEQKVREMFAEAGIIFERNKFVRFLPHATRLRAFVDFDIMSPRDAPRIIFENDEKQH